MLKLAILAKAGISVDILREALPGNVTFLREPIYKEHIDNSTAQSERDHRIKNEHLKNLWLKNAKRLMLREFYVVTDLGNSPIKDLSLT